MSISGQFDAPFRGCRRTERTVVITFSLSAALQWRWVARAPFPKR